MSVKKKISISIISKLTRFVTAFITSIIISRYLGPELNGVYRYVLLLINTSYLVSNLGIIEASNQRLALNKISKNSAFIFNLIWSLIIFIVVIIFFLLYFYLYSSFLEEQIISVAVFLLILTILQFAISSIITGMHKINEFNILLSVQFLVFFFGILALKISGLLSIINILICHIVAFLIFFIIGIVLVKPELDFARFNKEVSHNYLKEVFNRGLKIYLSNISTFLNYRLDMFLLKYFTDFRSIGLYSVSVSMVEKLWIIPESLRSIVFLEIAGKRKSTDFVSQIARLQLFGLIILSLFLAFTARLIIPMLYSEAYMESVIPFVILLPGILFFSLSKILASYFVGIDRIDINMISSLVSFGINLILNLFLIPKLGIIGASIATTISYTAGGFILLFQYTRFSQISFFKTLIIRKEDFILIFKLLKRSKRTPT